MVNICSVYNCKNNSSKNPKLNFFSLPSDNLRQLIWLPKMGRSEWILEKPENLSKKRICSEHFSDEMKTACKLKKDAFPNIFQEGTGEKGDKNASTSMPSSIEVEIEDASTFAYLSNNFENTTANDISPDVHINPKICTVSERKVELTQTSTRLSASTPRARKSQAKVKNPKRRKLSIQEKNTANIDDESFIRFCRQNFSETMADFMIAQLKLKGRNPHGYRYSRAYKEFALKIYFLGPNVYKFLRKTFALPHEDTLEFYAKRLRQFGGDQ